MNWFIDLFVSFDRFLNVLFKWPLNFLFGIKGFGHPDETISSVIGKHYYECKLCRVVCKFLSIFDERHCRDAIDNKHGYEEHG